MHGREGFRGPRDAGLFDEQSPGGLSNSPSPRPPLGQRCLTAPWAAQHADHGRKSLAGKHSLAFFKAPLVGFAAPCVKLGWGSRTKGRASTSRVPAPAFTGGFANWLYLNRMENACAGFLHGRVRSAASPLRAEPSETTYSAIPRYAPSIYTCRPGTMDETCRCWSTSLASRAAGYLTRIGSASVRTCRSGSTG
jgi:hypothetical protein